MPEPQSTDTSLYTAIYSGLMFIYAAITGHQYNKLNKLDDKIEKERERTDDKHVSTETFRAHMNTIQANLETIQVAMTANARFTDSQTRAIEKLFDTKQDKHP